MSTVVPPARVAVEHDTDGSKTFVYQREDHTLGLILQSYLLGLPEVDFAGYTVKGGTPKTLRVTVRAHPGSDPAACLARAVEGAQADVRDVREKWIAECSRNNYPLAVPAPEPEPEIAPAIEIAPALEYAPALEIAPALHVAPSAW